MSTEQLADAARRWAQAKAKAAQAEQEMLELAKHVTTEAPVMSSDARAERCRNAIVLVREKHGWSQQRLGIALGFKPGPAQARVSQIEHGYRVLTPVLFQQIAEAFGMTAAQLEASFSTQPTMSRSKRKIVEVLQRAINPLTIGVIADRVGETTSDTYNDVVSLVADGVLAQVRGGYSLAQKGKGFV